MKGPAKSLLGLWIILMLPASSAPQAHWVQNGAPVCTAEIYQDYPEITTADGGSAIIVWNDRRSGAYDIYAQKIDRYGNALWTADGVPVCTATGDQYYPRIVSDGAGGAIMCWHDGRSGWDIYAQRIDSDGAALWTANGVAVCAAANDQYYPELAPDGASGAVFAWIDMRGGNFDVYAQRLNASGTALWTANGVAVSTAANNQIQVSIISDDAFGAIIAWQDWRTGSADIYADKLDSGGNSMWTAGGAVVCSSTGGQDNPMLVTDGAGGAIITWTDYRAGNGNIYAQSIAAAGTVKWSVNGMPVCTATETQVDPRIATDSAGGAIIAWWDLRSGMNYDVYSQRIGPHGYPLWTSDGAAVSTATGAQYYPRITADGTGGAVIAWVDERAGPSDIYAQRLDALGTVLWTANGVGTCTASGYQFEPRLISNETGTVIVTWFDNRVAPNSNIFAQRLETKGNWGFPEPEIAFIRDVPGDQGGCVTAAWNASQYDPLGTITRYTIWRAIAGPLALSMVEGGARLVSSGAELQSVAEAASGNAALLASAGGMPPEADRGVIRSELRGGTTYYWELIESQDAYYLESYSKVVPTAFDSSAVCDEYNYFQIIAHTSAPLTFWISAPDSGYSVDNLSPCPPLGLAGDQRHAPEGLMLTWDPNAEADLDGYAVYRGLTEDFTPGPGNLLAEPCDTFTFDDDWRWDSAYFYKVAAVDVHGNESGCSLLRPTDVTGVDTPSAPRASFLAQNVPNPFNPATTIRFGLSEPAHVTLRIYDAAGRLVRTLVDDGRPAGRYEVTWSGRDSAGRASASGVYFYRLDAGAFSETKKMILLR